ncbi:MAG: M23 family metallopeptidase, partial [Actinobacteria bacterium]|nr:M23 family metallopeptidase [Actinomycetota bacterium]
ATGTNIRAPFDGVAEDASNSVGGTSVSVSSAGGYVYNAHASTIVKLGPVQAGEVIATVGATGNAAGTAPHDHFEWHPGGGGAVNPYPYLVSACG